MIYQPSERAFHGSQLSAMQAAVALLLDRGHCICFNSLPCNRAHQNFTATGSSHKAVDNSLGLADEAANFPQDSRSY